MRSKLKKFYISCCIVMAIGVLLTVAGAVTGGINSLGDVLEKHNKHIYIGGVSKNNYSEMYFDGKEFSSVRIDGNMDVRIKRGDYSDTNMKYLTDKSKAEMYVENGTLNIKNEITDGWVISFDFTDMSASNVVEIYCPEGATLKRIDILSEYADVDIEDVDYEDMNIELESGNLTLENSRGKNISFKADYGGVIISRAEYDNGSFTTSSGDITIEKSKSGGMSIESEYGDCRLSGAFSGRNIIDVESGDVKIVTELKEDDYVITTDTDMGSVIIGDSKTEGGRMKYGRSDAANSFDIATDMGDISVGFAK